MSVIYASGLRTSRMDAVKTAIDAGAGAGKLVIGTSALSGATGVLATLTLSDPCGTVSGDVLTFSAITDGTGAAGGGTAAKAEIRTSAYAVVVSGLTVGTSGANINLNSVTIGEGATVSVTSATITHNTAG